MNDTILKILICFLAGAGAGIGTGFAGMSAAAIIGPMLSTFLNVDPYQAVAVGLVSDVLASLSSAITYKKHKNLNLKESWILLICVLVMTFVGSYIANIVPSQTIDGSMQIAMILIGLRFIIFPIKNTKAKLEQQSKAAKIIKSIIGGCLVGFICGFVGAGGGMMLLFVLTTFLGYELHMAVGTSVLIMSFTALTGSISHFALGGFPSLDIVLLCIVFTLGWAKIAAIIANKAPTKVLNRIVGAILLLTSIAILLFDYVI